MRPALISRAVAAGTVRRPFNRARPLTSFFRCIEDARPLNSSCKRIKLSDVSTPTSYESAFD